MTSEWLRDSISTLIALYKKERFLYDTKSPLYYNRHARNRGLNKIVEGLQSERPGTTVNEVLKKIQTLRTQFGQEITKIKRSQARGLSGEFTYQPTVWWYEDMSFIQNFIKSRKDENSVGNILRSMKKTTSDDDLNKDEDDEETSTVSHKRRHSVEAATEDSDEYTATPADQSTPTVQHVKMKKYDDTPDNSVSRADSQKIEIIDVDENYMLKHDKMQRHEELGRFVSSQMATVKDDLLFYKTQHEVLSIINQAQLKQLEKNIANGTHVSTV